MKGDQWSVENMAAKRDSLRAREGFGEGILREGGKNLEEERERGEKQKRKRKKHRVGKKRSRVTA